MRVRVVFKVSTAAILNRVMQVRRPEAFHLLQNLDSPRMKGIFCEDLRFQITCEKLKVHEPTIHVHLKIYM